MCKKPERAESVNRNVSLSLYYQNVRGLNTKVENFYVQVTKCEYDIVCLTETWLSEKVQNSELFCNNYEIFRDDRQNAKGGGVAIAIRRPLRSTMIDLDKYVSELVPEINIVSCKVYIGNIPIILVLVYIPPSCSVSNYQDVFESIESCDIVYSKNLVVLGDFNLVNFDNSRCSNDQKCNLAYNFMDMFSLQQHNFIENLNQRCLDLVFTNFDCTVERAESPMVAEDVYHPALEVCLAPPHVKQVKFSVNANNGYTNYNFKKANFNNLYIEMLEADWAGLDEHSDVNVLCDNFYSILNTIFDRSVPRNTNNKKSKFPVWYSQDIIKKLKYKYNLRKKWKRSGNIVHLTKFRAVRSQTDTMIKEAYTQYIQKIQRSIGSDPGAFWRYIHQKQNNCAIPAEMSFQGRLVTSPDGIVESFGEYFKSVYESGWGDIDADILNVNRMGNIEVTLPVFTEDDIIKAVKKLKPKMSCGPDNIPSFIVKDTISVLARPLCKIFNLSLKRGVYPECWKVSKICPIYKKESKNEISNYRPVSLICSFSKVFEILLHDYVIFKIDYMISSHQHGFLRGRSTTTNLACFTQYTSKVVDDGGQVDLVLTDFSKAFDKINHTIILEKLKIFGLTDNFLSFFASYLRGRSQYVQYNGYKSRPFEATSGVPQGSNLGPLLFLIFINDISEVIDVEHEIFADDLKLYWSISGSEDCLRLQDSVDAVQRWCAKNKLLLNTGKCSVMTITKKLSPTLHEYSMEQDVLSRVDSVRDLGVLLDSKLSFSNHIEKMVSEATRMLGFILRNCKSFNNIDALKTLYFSLVRSKLEYGSLIWSPVYAKYNLMVEQVQRKFLKFLSFKEDNSYPERGINNELLLQRFNFDSLQKRRDMQAVILLFKIINGNTKCPSLLEQFNFLVPRISTRSSTCFYLPAGRTNTMLMSPMHKMCSKYNKIAEHCDLDMSFKLFVRTALTYV